MKSGNWMPIDKNIRCFLPHGRPYTEAEAILSLTLDMDNKKTGTISGYAKLWSWGRKKVRKFIEDLGTSGAHPRHRRGTGEAQGVTLKINNLQKQGNTRGTGKAQVRNTTIEPNPNPKKKKEDIDPRIVEIVATLNRVLGTGYKPSTSSTQRVIMARLEEGFTVADFEKVVRIKFSQWDGDPKWGKFLRPSTLFNGEKFEGYLQEKEVKPRKGVVI